MRFGTLWRLAVLASLALLVSGQLCMLTTCVPRLTSVHAAAHACCRGLPVGPTTDAPARAPVGASGMPCTLAMDTAAAPSLALPLAVAATPATLESSPELLAPLARVGLPRAPTDTGPPLDRHSPASAGLRAPPQA